LESWQPEQACGQVISRAFASLADFATAARHLAAASLRLLAMKGRYPETELEDLPDWVCVAAVEKLAVPGLQEERHLVIMSVNP
jgi:16S rRNA (guanine527-N7)-methyltransferase